MQPHILLAALTLVTGLAHAAEFGSCPPSLGGTPIKTTSIVAPGFINGPPDREVVSGSTVRQVWELSAEDVKNGTYVCVYQNGEKFERPIPDSSRECVKTLKHKSGPAYRVTAFSCK